MKSTGFRLSESAEPLSAAKSLRLSELHCLNFRHSEGTLCNGPSGRRKISLFYIYFDIYWRREPFRKKGIIFGHHERLFDMRSFF